MEQTLSDQDELKMSQKNVVHSTLTRLDTLVRSYAQSTLDTISYLDRGVLVEHADVGLASGDCLRGRTIEVDGNDLRVVPVKAVRPIAGAKLAPGVAAPAKDEKSQQTSTWLVK